MERALYITRVKDLSYFTEQYSRIYFGMEFCQNLIPRKEDLRRILEFIKKHSLSFSFTTPYVTNSGINSLIPLLTQIAETTEGSEVIFNDWGVCSIVTRQFPSLKLVLGRLLTKIKRDPRILFLKDRLPAQIMEYFQTTNLSIPWYRAFLTKCGIERVDLDNPLQGINLNFPDLHTSIYSPYGYITTTRLCLAADCNTPENMDKIGIFPCHRECQLFTHDIKNEVMPVNLYRKGNTIFYENNQLPSEGFDRLIYQPKLPL